MFEKIEFQKSRDKNNPCFLPQDYCGKINSKLLPSKDDSERNKILGEEERKYYEWYPRIWNGKGIGDRTHAGNL